VDSEDIAPKSPKRLFYGWWIVIAVILIQTLHGGLLFQAFGAYFVRLQAEFGWSRTSLSWSFSLLRVESGLLGPLQGWMIERFGAKIVLTIGLVIFGLGFMLLSTINSLLTFYLAFVVIAIGSSLGGFLTLFVTIANWFEKRRAMALGLAAIGVSIGGMMVPLVAYALNTYGWRATAFVSGWIVLGVGLPLVPLMRSNPERYGLLPDGAAIPLPVLGEDFTPDINEGDFTAKEAMKTAAFWMISFGHGSALLVVGALMVHLIPHLVDRMDMSLESAAVVVTVMTTTSIIGQVGGGFLGDRMDKRLIAAACMLGHTIALIGIAFASSLFLVYVFAIIHGLSWGTRGPLMMAIRADYFGRKSLPTIMGFSSMIITIGNVAGPVFAGFMADWQGDYQVGFVILAVLTGFGSIFFLAARKPAFPKRHNAHHSTVDEA
jgi:MFS family permease